MNTVRWLIRISSWGVLVSALVLLVITYVSSRWIKPPVASQAGLPEFGKVPPFSLTAHTGEPLTLDDLRGKVWIANFFFTTCRSICPPMQENVKAIHEAFAGNPMVRIVSFTVDPETDTVPVLKDYARKKGADDGTWLFVTGQKRDIYTLARKGFRVAADDVPEQIAGTTHDFIHSEKLALVDTQGRIRGYYSGLDMEQVHQAIRDAQQLLREGN